jgi:hypothetical protein
LKARTLKYTTRTRALFSNRCNENPTITTLCTLHQSTKEDQKPYLSTHPSLSSHLAHAEGLQTVFLGLHQGEGTSKHLLFRFGALRAAAAVKHQLLW